jgi:hypothetical protein
MQHGIKVDCDQEVEMRIEPASSCSAYQIGNQGSQASWEHRTAWNQLTKELSDLGTAVGNPTQVS